MILLRATVKYQIQSIDSVTLDSNPKDSPLIIHDPSISGDDSSLQAHISRKFRRNKLRKKGKGKQLPRWSKIRAKWRRNFLKRRGAVRNGRITYQSDRHATASVRRRGRRAIAKPRKWNASYRWPPLPHPTAFAAAAHSACLLPYFHFPCLLWLQSQAPAKPEADKQPTKALEDQKSSLKKKRKQKSPATWWDSA